jgi:hypothetical protein
MGHHLEVINIRACNSGSNLSAPSIMIEAMAINGSKRSKRKINFRMASSSHRKQGKTQENKKRIIHAHLQASAQSQNQNKQEKANSGQGKLKASLTEACEQDEAKNRKARETVKQAKTKKQASEQARVDTKKASNRAGKREQECKQTAVGNSNAAQPANQPARSRSHEKQSWRARRDHPVLIVAA